MVFVGSLNVSTFTIKCKVYDSAHVWEVAWEIRVIGDFLPIQIHPLEREDSQLDSHFDLSKWGAILRESEDAGDRSQPKMSVSSMLQATAPSIPLTAEVASLLGSHAYINKMSDFKGVQ